MPDFYVMQANFLWSRGVQMISQLDSVHISRYPLRIAIPGVIMHMDALVPHLPALQKCKVMEHMELQSSHTLLGRLVQTNDIASANGSMHYRAVTYT